MARGWAEVICLGRKSDRVWRGNVWHIISVFLSPRWGLTDLRGDFLGGEPGTREVFPQQIEVGLRRGQGTVRLYRYEKRPLLPVSFINNH